MITEPTSIPDRIGVMLLPHAVLLPGAMVPLYIFEPRYREMLAAALEGQRIFAIASPENDNDEEATSFPTIGGAGIVRACVKNDDGTSQLVLQGISRVRLSGWDPLSNFPAARAEPIHSVESDPTACLRLRKEVFGQIARLIAAQKPLQRELLDSLEACADTSSFSDLAASCVVGDPSIRVLLLQETDARRRLEILAALLTEVPASPPE